MLVSKYETFQLTSITQSFDNEIWSSFKVGYLGETQLNEIQKLEYSKLKEYSEYLMRNNFIDIKTSLDRISKSITGYSIYRSNSTNKYIINLHFYTNQIEIKRSI